MTSIVNFMREMPANEFAVASPQNVLPGLVAVDRVHWSKNQNCNYWRSTKFSAAANQNARLFKTVGMSSSIFVLDWISGEPDDVETLLRHMIAQCSRCHCHMLIAPRSRPGAPDKAKADQNLLKILSGFPALQKIDPAQVETEFPKSLPLMLFLNQAAPNSPEFEGVLA